MKLRLQNDVISPWNMLLWTFMVGAAAAPIWIKAPFWYAPYVILIAAFALILLSYVVMLLTYEHTMRIMRPHFETKLKRRAFYEYVACIVVTFLLLIQGHWLSATLTGVTTAAGIYWRILLEREVAKYRYTLH